MCCVNAIHGKIAITENQPLYNVAVREPAHYSRQDPPRRTNQRTPDHRVVTEPASIEAFARYPDHLISRRMHADPFFEKAFPISIFLSVLHNRRSYPGHND